MKRGLLLLFFSVSVLCFRSSVAQEPDAVIDEKIGNRERLPGEDFNSSSSIGGWDVTGEGDTTLVHSTVRKSDIDGGLLLLIENLNDGAPGQYKNMTYLRAPSSLVDRIDWDDTTAIEVVLSVIATQRPAGVDGIPLDENPGAHREPNYDVGWHGDIEFVRSDGVTLQYRLNKDDEVDRPKPDERFRFLADWDEGAIDDENRVCDNLSDGEDYRCRWDIVGSDESSVLDFFSKPGEEIVGLNLRANYYTTLGSGSDDYAIFWLGSITPIGIPTTSWLTPEGIILGLSAGIAAVALFIIGYHSTGKKKKAVERKMSALEAATRPLAANSVPGSGNEVVLGKDSSSKGSKASKAKKKRKRSAGSNTSKTKRKNSASGNRRRNSSASNGGRATPRRKSSGAKKGSPTRTGSPGKGSPKRKGSPTGKGSPKRGKNSPKRKGSPTKDAGDNFDTLPGGGIPSHAPTVVPEPAPPPEPAPTENSDETAASSVLTRQQMPQS